MFITFEGIEGSGKTTQARLLYQWFIDRGREALFTREPGGTPAAEEIREFILTEKEEPFPENAELFLYMAARSFHVENLIRPALKSGTIVISDRFSDATVAYQGFGRGIQIEKIEYLNNIATKGLKPDITFLIDIPVEEGLKRIQERKLDRIEKETVEFHKRVREGYLQIAKKEPDRIVVIDGRKKIEEIFEIIKITVERKTDAV